jgi:hypothetical protein
MLRVDLLVVLVHPVRVALAAPDRWREQLTPALQDVDARPLEL